MNLEIRKLEERDLSSSLDLLKQLTVAGKDFDYIKIFREFDKNYHVFICIDKENDKIVGMATIFIEQKFIHSGGKVGHIEDVVVDEKYRKKGLGKLLIDECVNQGKEENCYKIILDCDDKNIDFYNKCGFKKYGVSMKIVL